MPKTKPPRGSTLETAIPITADCSGDAVARENEHLSRIFGADLEMRLQALIKSGNRHFDRITIEIGRRTETIYFDITSCFPVEPTDEQTYVSDGR